MASATAASVTVVRAVLPTVGSHGSKVNQQQRRGGLKEMKAFAGMKAESQVNKLGRVESTEVQFARAMAVQCAASSLGRRGRGGAATSTCNVADEIFRIVPIMSGLTLVGIALGFVLLRIEAAVEEAEAE